MDNYYFLTDDYFEIYNKHFAKNKSYFNPATIAHETRNLTQPVSTINASTSCILKYHNDDTDSGNEARERLALHYSTSDNQEITSTELTLSPSITSASLIVIQFLRESGIQEVWLESPCYYATYFQLKSFGISVNLIPTYQEDDFVWDIKQLPVNKKIAVWITQPIISLAINQTESMLLEVCDRLLISDSYLVVDEAAELQVPPLLSRKSFDQYRRLIIRLRSMSKPVGINGVRLCVIHHNYANAKEIKKWTWTFQGGIDAYSMGYILQLTHTESHYKSMLLSTKSQAEECYKRLKNITQDSDLELPVYENGYTASFSVQLSNTKLSKRIFYKRRLQLIMDLEKMKVFPTLSSSMYFAFDGLHERIRVNYLSNPNKLEELLISIIRNGYLL